MFIYLNSGIIHGKHPEIRIGGDIPHVIQCTIEQNDCMSGLSPSFTCVVSYHFGNVLTRVRRSGARLIGRSDSSVNLDLFSRLILYFLRKTGYCNFHIPARYTMITHG